MTTSSATSRRKRNSTFGEDEEMDQFLGSDTVNENEEMDRFLRPFCL